MILPTTRRDFGHCSLSIWTFVTISGKILFLDEQGQNRAYHCRIRTGRNRRVPAGALSSSNGWGLHGSRVHDRHTKRHCENAFSWKGYAQRIQGFCAQCREKSCVSARFSRTHNLCGRLRSANEFHGSSGLDASRPVFAYFQTRPGHPLPRCSIRYSQDVPDGPEQRSQRPDRRKRRRCLAMAR